MLPQFKLTPTAVTAIASAAHIVTMAYLDELIRRAQLPATDAASLEASFEPPDPADFLPPNGAAPHLTDEALPNVLLSNPERPTFFRGATALMVHSGSQPEKSDHLRLELFKICGGNVAFLRLDDANLSSQSEAQRTLRPFKTAALSRYSSYGEEARFAPDEGLVVLFSLSLEKDDVRYVNLCLATRSMSIRTAEEGTQSIVDAIVFCDPRSRLNATAAVPAEPQPDDDMQEPGDAADDIQESAGPPPTAATAGSSMAPLDRMDDDDLAQTQTEAPPRVEAPLETTEPPPTQRRRLKRKAPGHSAFDDIFGSANIDDDQAGPSSAHDRGADMPPPSAATPDAAQTSERHTPTHHLSAAQLKKRANATQRQSRLSDIFGSSATGTPSTSNGPPGSQSVLGGEDSGRLSKRYRALLEQEESGASQPGTLDQNASHDDTGTGTIPLSQQDPRPTRAEIQPNPDTVEHQPSAGTRDPQATEAGGKRQQKTMTSPSSKTSVRSKRDTGAASAAPAQVIRSEKGPRGQAPGQKPDTEPELLRALATHRKGKKGTLDDFDKEFNNLRLAKPKTNQKHGSRVEAEGKMPIEEDEDYQAWKAASLQDFALPVGNFIQVDYVPLVRDIRRSKSDSVSDAVAPSGHPDWQNRPNFKKFKAKTRPTRKALSMALTEPQDFGMGPDYLANPGVDVRLGSKTSTQLGGDEEAAGDHDDDDEDDDVAMQLDSGAPVSGRRGNSARKVSGGPTKPSILKALAESDDEEEDEAQPPPTNRRRRRLQEASPPPPRQSQARRRQALLAESSSEDELETQDKSVDLRLARNLEDTDLSNAALLPGKSGRTVASAGTRTGTPSTISRDASQASRPATGDHVALSSSSRPSGNRKRPASMLTDDEGLEHSSRGSRRATNDAQNVQLRDAANDDEEEGDDGDDGCFKGFKGTQKSSRSAKRNEGEVNSSAAVSNTRGSKRSRA